MLGNLFAVLICFRFVIQNAGFRFPPRRENVGQFLSPPQIHPVIEQHASPYDDLAAQVSLQSDASGLR